MYNFQMTNIISTEKNYSVAIQFFDWKCFSIINQASLTLGKTVGQKTTKETFDKISVLLKRDFRNNFTDCDLLKPLGTALKELVKRKIESLNLFYDDLPEVNLYYDQFTRELSALRYKNWGTGATVSDPFPTLKKIDQALSKVGVVDGMQTHSFLEILNILFESCDLMEISTGAFLFSPPKEGALPVKLSLALKLCGEHIFQLRSDIEKFLFRLEEVVLVQPDSFENLPFLDMPLVKSALKKSLTQLPTEFYLFDDFPEALGRRIYAIISQLKENCAFFLDATSIFLDPIEAGIRELTEGAPEVNKVEICIKSVKVSLNLEQLIKLKNYYEQTFELQTFFDGCIHDTIWKLAALFTSFDEWKQKLPSHINVEDLLRRAAAEMYPEEQQAETEAWLAELDKEKSKKQKKLGRKRAQPKGAKKSATSTKKVTPIRTPSPEKSIARQPHPILYGLIAGIHDLHTKRFAALKQAYLFEGDLKLIQRKVVQGGLDNGQMMALFLSTVRTSYLFLEQLFRSLKEDQISEYGSEKSHDLYSFGEEFVGLNPHLVKELFLGNFWVDYAEDHLDRWRRSGRVINRTTPALLTRSERVFKKDCKAIAASEITDLIRDVFETKSRWLKTAYSEQVLGTEDPKESSFSLTFPKFSFEQTRKQLQGLLDQHVLDENAVDQQRRTLAYLEETLKGANETSSSSEKSYQLRTALHLMHLALEWGFERYGYKQGLRSFRDHNLLQLAKNVGYPLTANKVKYLTRFFQFARPLSSYPYDQAEKSCDLIPLILKLDYKANYALHQKERPLFPKINLSEEEAGKLMTALANGFIPLLQDLMKALQI